MVLLLSKHSLVVAAQLAATANQHMSKGTQSAADAAHAAAAVDSAAAVVDYLVPDHSDVWL